LRSHGLTTHNGSQEQASGVKKKKKTTKKITRSFSSFTKKLRLRRSGRGFWKAKHPLLEPKRHLWWDPIRKHKEKKSPILGKNKKKEVDTRKRGRVPQAIRDEPKQKRPRKLGKGPGGWGGEVNVKEVGGGKDSWERTKKKSQSRGARDRVGSASPD